jgi:hypothetical protein
MQSIPPHLTTHGSILTIFTSLCLGLSNGLFSSSLPTSKLHAFLFFHLCYRLCGLVVRVLGYRSRGPGSIPGTTKKKVVGLERGPLGLVSTTEELLDRKVAAPV